MTIETLHFKREQLNKLLSHFRGLEEKSGSLVFDTAIESFQIILDQELIDEIAADAHIGYKFAIHKGLENGDRERIIFDIEGIIGDIERTIAKK